MYVYVYMYELEWVYMQSLHARAKEKENMIDNIWTVLCWNHQVTESGFLEQAV